MSRYIYACGYVCQPSHTLVLQATKSELKLGMRLGCYTKHNVAVMMVTILSYTDVDTSTPRAIETSSPSSGSPPSLHEGWSKLASGYYVNAIALQAHVVSCVHTILYLPGTNM